jgi:hypothetical protein
MKQKNIRIIITAIEVLVILAGIVVINIMGFNKELRFSQSQSIDVYIEQEVDKDKVKSIVNDVLGSENNMVQTVEIYKDMVTIRAKEITDEQKDNIVSKLKENYEFEQTAENTTVKTVPATKIRDMYKKYIIPFIISGVLVLIYMAIRYFKKGIWKVLARTICMPILGELFLLAIIAITRIPVGRFIPVLVIGMYIASIMGVVKENEK